MGSSETTAVSSMLGGRYCIGIRLYSQDKSERLESKLYKILAYCVSIAAIFDDFGAVCRRNERWPNPLMSGASQFH